jgi:hypothetical protein
MTAIGLISKDQRYINEDPPKEDVACPDSKAVLNPKLFHRLVDRTGGMSSESATRILPAIQSQISLRRNMSTTIEWTDHAGELHQVRVGASVPQFVTKVVELAYKKSSLFRRHQVHHKQLAECLSAGGGALGPHPESGTVGKRDLAAHKRLQVLTTSLHAERFTQSYAAQRSKTGVEEMNTL